MQHNPPSVLIIDDDELILDRLTSLLCNEFTCYAAKTAQQGLTVFDRIGAENLVVICDIDLPDIIGFDVCKTIKSSHPGTCVMLLTGFSSKMTRMKGLYAYADNCLDKTLDDAELRLLIRNASNTMHPQATITPPPTVLLKGDTLFTGLETKVKRYITSYYKKPITQRSKNELSVTHVAPHFNLTERTFQRQIKDITGCSYTKFLTQQKLEKSKELLAKELSITQISELLEYSSPSHYSREFKRYTGVTPNRYKRTSKGLC